ncbi:MAG: mechanosensitive ion channel [Planctomycetaceae bacterium]|nr:mechanosensitive ion channel [Planctomycetaceae bacterium]
MRRIQPYYRLATQVVVCLLIAATALGQTTPPKQLTDAELIALLQTRKKQVDEIRDLDDATKAKVRDLCDQGLAEMEKIKGFTARMVFFDQRAAHAPTEIEQTKAALAALPTQPSIVFPAEVTLPQIEQAIAGRQAELETWRRDLANVETELKGRGSRRADIPKDISRAQQVLSDINGELQAPAAADETSATTAARRFMLLAKRRAAEQEVLCCQKELAASEARADLLPISRDLNARRVALGEQQVKQWQELVNGRRQQDAEQQARQAAWEAGQAIPAVKQLAQENAALAELRKSLAQHIADATSQLNLANQQLTALRSQYERARGKVETVGLTNAIGLLLRKQRDTLPNLAAYRRQINGRQQTLADGQFALLQWQDHRAALANLDQQTQVVLQNLVSPEQAGNRVQLETAVREALNAQKDYLDALIADQNTYFGKLEDLDTAQRQLVAESERFERYIDERVLWIASAAPLGPVDARWAGDAAWWLARPESLLELGRAVVADARANIAIWAAAIGVFLLLTYRQRRGHARIEEIGQQAMRGSCCRFVPTIEAAALTAIMAIPGPGLLWFLGWRLAGPGDPSELCKAVGMGFTEAAKVYLAMELLRQTCAKQGLGEAHLGWSVSALKVLRQNIRWFSLPMLLMMFVAVTMAWQQNDRWDASLGRISFVSGLLCFTLVLQRILRPAGVMFQTMFAERRGGWLDRFRNIWCPACVLLPTALAVLAMVGYHYTARQLVIRLILSIYVLVGGLVCRALLLRWTLVSQRKLAIEQARHRRATAASDGSAEESDVGALIASAAAPQLDLAAINIQTRRFIGYSLGIAAALAFWCAWVDVLPALGIFNRIEVWQTTVSVSETVPTADGKTQTKVTERPSPVTVASLGLAIIILATTVIAAKNIPGLLEMAVLQHLPLDTGARYAVSTVSRYAITVFGMLLCFGMLGVGWSKVQWLVAGMGVGLGFGLQEIFANFISGLIILFERPVRVGDVVTIDTFSGVVSKIRSRATTITDGDRKELIIPNKEFITGRVLNWTLSDPVNRVVINVGVAYGSDTQKAAAILEGVARNHPHVLDDPPPRAMLDSLSDGSLHFVLHCFLPNLDNRQTVIHELHVAIDREFRRSGIDFALPQQELHVRSIDVPFPSVPPSGRPPAERFPRPAA